MTKTEIRHVVFDIGQVLIHWDPELIYLDLIPDEAERRHFLDTICTAEWNIEQDRGREWSHAEDLLIADHPEKADLIRAYRTDWLTSVPHAYDDVVKIMTGLIEAGHDVTMLTNFHQDTFVESKARFSFLNQPRGVTVSGEVKLIKPDPAIYALHTETHDLDPTKTLFIDDSAANVASARNAGWNALHFAGREGAGKLREGLERFGVF